MLYTGHLKIYVFAHKHSYDSISIFRIFWVGIGQKNSFTLYKKIKYFFIDNAKKSVGYNLDNTKITDRYHHKKNKYVY
jgi:hypothetical protein